MRRIAIVGAGQSGLQLALGLLDTGYDVTLLTNRTADQIRDGKVMSSQCMFHTALQTERDLGLNFWEEQCPAVEGIGLNLINPETGDKAFSWSARLERYAQSVDQRVKMPYWIEEFQRRGGKLVIQDVGIAELEVLAEDFELVLLAAGKGEVVKQFERDAQRSEFDQPQRALALTYVKGMQPLSPYSRVNFNIIPGVGEYFCFPALTVNGPCDIMVFEGIPGGPMDCWQDVKSPEQHLAKSLEILNTLLPWEGDRCKNVELTDAGGYLAGRFAPTVRKPILTLPSGKQVFGMADALVVNDPITGQGSNNAAKCSKVYFEAILANDDQAFTEAWMQQTFERYWDYAETVVSWTNSLLAPPKPHMVELLAAASQNQSIAAEIANNFDDPRQFAPWWFDADQAQAFIESKSLQSVA
ncbi:2-polyprenyl-6-methoxyphenol hydroxylase-like FAD-dependent oxidoreductase [Acinetobacter calcoaceticus]|uniref:2-polyprenyl-6-methoxyphenol hydroxylase-like FAD-dependent oxidoreductase n=1 Tax=Acinetobacter calcoaceticus TaxID=471 RepID=A0A4R1XT70_ACICA|nr:2-polyprenyl-6-methoxyphenol hydroxylase-like FAD-dependent oxidoreductase [Acinetobacter calcoaceticus]